MHTQWVMLAIGFYVVCAAPLLAIILSAWVQLHERNRQTPHDAHKHDRP